MKILILFFVSLSLSHGSPVAKTWTMKELEKAVSTIDVYNDQSGVAWAFNKMMMALFTGKYLNETFADLVSPSGSPIWTVAEYKELAKNNESQTELGNLMSRNAAQLYVHDEKKAKIGIQNMADNDTFEIVLPAYDISTWTRQDMIKAIAAPETKPKLLPYLKDALIELEKPLPNGEKRETMALVTPVGFVAGAPGLPVRYLLRQFNQTELTRKPSA